MDPHYRRGTLLLELWLAAFAVLLVLYVAWNPPLARMAGNLAPLLFALVFVGSFAGFGGPVARRMLPGADGIDQLLTAVAVGLGLTGMLVFFAGVAGVTDSWLYALWTALGLLLLVIDMLRRRIVVQLEPLRLDGLTVVAIVALAITVVSMIPALVAPPSSTDALEYHLLIPKLYLGSGEIYNIPLLVEASYPSLVEYLYMPVLVLAGDVACKCLHFWLGICALLAMARLSARISPAGNRLLAPALFLSMPVVSLTVGLAWNDGLFVFLLLLAFGQLLDHHLGERHDLRHLLVAGVLTGLAAWTKYTIVMILLSLAPLLAIAVIWWRWRWVHVLAYAAPVGLISLLVFVKNLLFTGNPFFPFLSSIFPSANWSPAAAEHFAHAVQAFEIPHWGWSTFLLFPFHLSLNPRLVDVHPGILPLLFVPLLLLRSENTAQSFLKVFLSCHLVVWLVLHTETRSLLTMLAVLIPVAVCGLERVLAGRPAYLRPTLLLLVAAVLTNLAMAAVSTWHLTRPMDFFLGLESRDAYLLREARSQPAFAWLNSSSEVDRVLLVGLHGPYHLDRPAYFSSFSDPPVAEVLSRNAVDVLGLDQALRSLEISHLVIDAAGWRHDHEAGLYSWPEEQKRLFEDFVRSRCKVEARFGAETVYRIQSS